MMAKLKAWWAAIVAYFTHAAAVAGTVVATADFTGINSVLPSFLEGKAAKVVSGALFAGILVRELLKGKQSAPTKPNPPAS